jgi:hypothetical protein
MKIVDASAAIRPIRVPFSSQAFGASVQSPNPLIAKETILRRDSRTQVIQKQRARSADKPLLGHYAVQIKRCWKTGTTNRER